MAKPVLIRFVGERAKAYYYLKLGPADVWNPPERKFQGGDEVTVEILPNAINADCVDLTFDDGQFAIEVPREYFVIVEERYGR